MKPSKTQIKDYLERLQKKSRPIIRAKQELDKAIAFKASLEEQINGLNGKNYADLSLVQELSVAQAQLALCDKEIARLENKTFFVSAAEIDEDDDAAPGIPWHPVLEILNEGQSYVGAVLLSALELRAATIKACLLPFSENDRAADTAARRTDAFSYGMREIQRYSLLASSIRMTPDPATQFAHVCALIQKVLNEACQDSPNLVQFLPSPESANVGVGPDTKPTH